MPIEMDHIQAVAGAGDTYTLHRVYSQAKRSIADRIQIDEDIERRLAIVVLFTFADALATSASVDEGSVVHVCVDRLMARTSAA